MRRQKKFSGKIRDEVDSGENVVLDVFLDEEGLQDEKMLFGRCVHAYSVRVSVLTACV